MVRSLVAYSNAEVQGLPPNVQVRLTWDTDAQVTVARRDPDLSRAVRGCEPVTVTAGSPVDIFDYEAPLNEYVVYEAVDENGLSAISDGTRNDGYYGYVNDVGWSGDGLGAVWLKHLTIPQLSMQVDLSNADSPQFAQTRSVQAVLNRRDPIVLSDTKRKYPTSTLDIRTWSLEEATRLRRLLADNTVLLLQVPVGERWGISNWYLAIGDVTEERLWQEWAPYQGRVFHLPVEIVGRPSGGVLFPSCCYWSRQEGQASYAAFDTQSDVPDGFNTYRTYAQLASCDVNAVAPPDPPDNPPQEGADNPSTADPQFVTLASTSRTTSDGTYGTIASTITYGGYGFFTDQGNNPVQSGAPIPQVAVSKVVTLTAGNRYKVSAQLQTFRVDQGGTLTAQLRLTPGSSATPASGTLLATSTPTRTYTAGERVNYLPNDASTGSDAVFTAPSTGQYVLAWVLTGQGITSISTATDVASTSNMYMSVNVSQATVSTTGSGADNVTMSLTASLSAGTVYTVTGTQYFQNAANAVTYLTRYVYGAATGTSPGLGVPAQSVASIGSTPVALTSAGQFQATSTGTWTIVTVVSSNGNVDDATSTDRAATLAIGAYV